MKIVCLDTEHSEGIYNPWEKGFYLTCCGIVTEEDGERSEEIIWFDHADVPQTVGAIARLMFIVGSADVLVFHNAKHDINVLLPFGVDCGAASIYCTQVADYPSERMVTIEELEALLEQEKKEQLARFQLLDPLLLDMDTAVKNYPEVNITEEMGSYVLHGQPVQVFGAPDNTIVRITVGDNHTFIGVGQMNDDGLIAPKRLANL